MAPRPDPDSEQLAQTLDLLRRTVALLEGITGRLDDARGERLLTKAGVARRLGVSTRWVERHLTPTAQPARRGRAWYAEEDVERQLASWRRDAEARASAAPRSRRERRGTVAQDARAKEIEDELRRDLERRR